VGCLARSAKLGWTSRGARMVAGLPEVSTAETPTFGWLSLWLF